MTTKELAEFLGYDRRLLERRAQRGEIPCQKVGGQYRFNRAEIHCWLKQTMGSWDSGRLTDIDAGITSQTRFPKLRPVLADHLKEVCIDAHLDARTKNSLLHKLVALGQNSDLIYDADALMENVRHRERLGSTALKGGVAIPHPHRPLPYALADTILVVARTDQAIVFGAPKRELTQLFFLTASQDTNHHIHILARLCRLLQDQDLIEALLESESAEEMMTVLVDAEAQLVA